MLLIIREWDLGLRILIDIEVTGMISNIIIRSGVGLLMQICLQEIQVSY